MNTYRVPIQFHAENDAQARAAASLIQAAMDGVLKGGTVALGPLERGAMYWSPVVDEKQERRSLEVLPGTAT